MTLLEMSNVSKTFHVTRGFKSIRTVNALEDVSLDLERGEIVGLAGASGSGKSTIARILTLLYSPDRGALKYDGKDSTNLPPRSMRKYRMKVQMIFQDPYSSLDPVHDVEWHIARPLKIVGANGDISDRISTILTEVGLTPDEFRKKLPFQLSGGQRQRVYMARVLALNPEVIIADEPVSNLDASIRAGILDLLLQLRKERNISFLYISHDLSTISYLTDRVYIINNGRMVESGKTSSVLDSPKDEYTKQLIEAAPDPYKRI